MTGFEIQQNARIKAYLNRNKQHTSNSPLPLDALLKKNSHTLVVMSPDEFWDFMKKYYQRKGYSEEGTIQLALQQLIKKGLITEDAKQKWEEHRTTIKSAGGVIPSFLDAKALVVLAAEMKRGGNLFSKFRIQHYAGASYIILKGNPALRTHLTGTRYLANNPKVVSMGLGKAGATNAIRGGGIVTVIFSALFHGMDQLMNDELTWHHFVGGLASDVVIAAAASGITWGILNLSGVAIASMAIGPLLIVVAAGIITATLLSILIDDRLKDLFVDCLKSMEKASVVLKVSTKSIFHFTSIKVKSSLHDALITVKRDIDRSIYSGTRHLESAHNDPEGFLHMIFSIPDNRRIF